MGMVVTDFLSEHFTNIMDYNFTAEAEEALDDIAEGSVEWQKMIGEFYHPFHETVESTLKNSERNSGQRILGTDPVSGETVSVRIGRFGPMAQIGEGEHVRYAGLLKGQLMEPSPWKRPWVYSNFHVKSASTKIKTSVSGSAGSDLISNTTMCSYL